MRMVDLLRPRESVAIVLKKDGRPAKELVLDDDKETKSPQEKPHVEPPRRP